MSLHAPRHVGLVAALAVGVALSGCSREEIRAYRIPKEQPPMTADAAHAGHVHQRPHAHYETPSGWQEVQPGSMHIASFVIKSDQGEARVTVTPLPGAKDIEVDAVNMWRSELQLPALTAEDFEKQSQAVKIGNAEGKLVEFTAPANGTNGVARQTTGALATIEGALWFFKLTGDQAVVAANKDKLKQFLASMDVHAGEHETGSASGGESAAAAPQRPSQGPALPEWEPPASWQSKTPGQMVLAAFNVSGQEGQAEVTITSFPGDTGGLVANIDRWRRQVGLGPIDPSDIPKVATTVGEGSNQFTVVDFVGKNPRSGKETRLVTAIVKVGANSWYYKMMGDAPVVEREKENLLNFVKSAKYPNAG
ncbi:MAG TPA: hypothetical protein VEH27_14530 [Methylomirabilota bacterium]|nr:hypothetical protein [Methylomirabilota bacterium]